MTIENSSGLPRSDGLTPAASKALEIFVRDTRRSYGYACMRVVLFGSRARSEAGPDSDVDVAVVLDKIVNRAADRNRLADIAYEAVVAYVDVHALPVSQEEWEHPELHRNPALIRAIKRDGMTIESGCQPSNVAD